MEDRFQDRDGIFDTTINDYANTEDIIKLLNNADKRIKELEEENSSLKEQNKALIDEEDYISEKMKEVGFDNIEDLCNSQKQVSEGAITLDSNQTVNNHLLFSDGMETNKVYIWGYELCKGSDWNAFLEVVNKLGEENKRLKMELKSQPSEIVEKIRKQIFNHFNVKNIEEYERLPLLNALFTADAAIEILDAILKEYQK